MSLVQEAVAKGFTAEKMNIELLGNGDAHLHWHLFPRRRGDMNGHGLKGCGPVWWVPFEKMTAETRQAKPDEIRLPVKQNMVSSSMNDEASKQLTDTRFKCLVGVQRTTFEEMLAVLKTAYQLKHAKGGRKPKLSLEDLLMAHESNLLRRSQWVEVTLVQSGVTISRTPLSSEDTVMIDSHSHQYRIFGHSQ
ncbi:transposase-like protein%2C IS1381 ISSpn7 [Streptococcus pneumoniae]|nr:transposase-like protein%2C IS1381 ISSpn7 [Streptococcus pneumoniae]COQ01952.1 transposase-like protein%2C IS1381 ISSpn7 [Streptococcus pneumoniae]